MNRAVAWAMLALAGAAAAAESVTAGFHPATPASATAAAPRRHVAVPAANFLVEWRLQAVDAAPARGGIVITSGSAATGTSGYGAGAVVVGTARPAPPQALRVANGKEGSILFDRSETHTAWDMAYAADAAASASTDATRQVVQGAASSATSGGGSRSSSQSREREVRGHETVVRRVDGLRVTPHWVRGDTLELDVALTHAAPARGADAQSRTSRDIDFHSTVQASFDEWLTLATVGDGAQELQIRVTWR